MTEYPIWRKAVNFDDTFRVLQTYLIEKDNLCRSQESCDLFTTEPTIEKYGLTNIIKRYISCQ